jgi:acyl carrier protein
LTDRADVESRVCAIVANHLKTTPEHLPPGATVDELGIDSVKAMAVAIDLEDTFGFMFPMDGQQHLHGGMTIADLARLVGELARP